MLTVVAFLVGVASDTIFNLIHNEDSGPFDWWYQLLLKLPEPYGKPFGLCFTCFTAQLAFWFYLISFRQNYFEDCISAAVMHIVFIFATIGIAERLKINVPTNYQNTL